jgi:hypothetical protein
MIGTANNGQVTLKIDYDDQTLLIQDIVLVNNATRGTITLTATNPNNGNIVDQTSRTAGTGTFTKDVSARGLHMVHSTGTNKFGPYDLIVPPFDLSMEWSSA